MRVFPRPTPGEAWREWAYRLLHALSRDDTRAPVKPAFIMPDDALSVVEDGIVMYDPSIEEMVFSKNGAWHRIRTNAVV